jgi:hypothetical protein
MVRAAAIAPEPLGGGRVRLGIGTLNGAADWRASRGDDDGREYGIGEAASLDSVARHPESASGHLEFDLEDARPSCAAGSGCRESWLGMDRPSAQLQPAQ